MSALQKIHRLKFELNFKNEEEKLCYLNNFQCVSCKLFTWIPFQFINTITDEVYECLCEACLDMKLGNPVPTGVTHFLDLAKIKNNLPDVAASLYEIGLMTAVDCINCNEVFLEEKNEGKNSSSVVVLMLKQKLNTKCARNSKNILAETVEELNKSVFDLTKKVKDKDVHIQLLAKALQRIEARCGALEEKSRLRDVETDAVAKNLQDSGELHRLSKTLGELSLTVCDLSNTVQEESLRLQLLDNAKYYGKFIWKIDQVEERLQQAKDDIVSVFHSAQMYVDGRDGYKGCT